jgi:hypothetical protein
MKAELLKHPASHEITNRNIRLSSCLQCKPCGSDCSIADNRISLVFDSETTDVSYPLSGFVPIACMGGCDKTDQIPLRLMQELTLRVIPEELLNNNQHMSIINIISNDELTLVQGVNGLFFCEESWVTQSREASRIGKVLPKENIGTKDQSINIVHPQTDRIKLSCQMHETSYF